MVAMQVSSRCATAPVDFQFSNAAVGSKFGTNRLKEIRRMVNYPLTAPPEALNGVLVNELYSNLAGFSSSLGIHGLSKLAATC